MDKLQHEICTIDFESTGLDVEKDRIVEIGITIIKKDLSKVSISKYVNPGMPIPTSSTAIHGITDEMVADAPPFIEFIPSIMEAIEDRVILTFNGNRFDRSLLYYELLRYGYEWDHRKHTFIDSFVIFQRQYKRDLKAAYLEYCGKVLEGAHRAAIDTDATADVFLAQIERHQDLPDNLPGLHLYCNHDKKDADLAGKFEFNEDGDPIIKIGKHKGKTIFEITKIDPTYYDWFSKSDFPKDSKDFFKSFL